MNICVSQKDEFYVNVQATPINLGVGAVRFLLCFIRFSAIKELNVLFSDRSSGRYWVYDTKLKEFVEDSRFILPKSVLEMLRLSRMGHSVDDIANIMHRSRDTVKMYRKQAFDKLNVGSIEEAIAMCDLHHLI